MRSIELSSVILIPSSFKAFPKIPELKMSKLDYLKRYMSKDEDDNKSKKKKKKSKKDHPASG